MTDGDGGISITYQDHDTDAKVLGGRAITRIGAVSAQNLAQNLGTLTSELGQIFADLRSRAPGLELDGMDVTVELTGSGGVRLVGSVQAEVRGGITLRFRARS